MKEDDEKQCGICLKNTIEIWINSSTIFLGGIQRKDPLRGQGKHEASFRRPTCVYFYSVLIGDVVKKRILCANSLVLDCFEIRPAKVYNTRQWCSKLQIVFCGVGDGSHFQNCITPWFPQPCVAVML